MTVVASLLLVAGSMAHATSMDLWFSPGWKAKPGDAKAIAKALSNSGIDVKPRIAKGYPEILQAFSTSDASLVYVGSFVQAIVHARGLGEGLVQSVNGKELYSGVLIHKKGEDPKQILGKHGDKIAFAVGASSGESSAKAATRGKASIKTRNHAASVGALKAGKAKGAVVKNWWWDKNKAKYPGYVMYKIPGVSINKNPDNVLSASKAVSAAQRKAITDAAMKNKSVFKAKKMASFDKSKMGFSLELMKKGKIDPMTYTW